MSFRSLARWSLIVSQGAVLLSFSAYGQGLGRSPLVTGVSVEVSHLQDTSHLEFKGRDAWVYDIKREGDRIVSVSVPALDEKSLLSVRTFSSPLVRSVAIDDKAPQGQTRLLFTLTDASVQSFDYQTDQPARLIVDFFQQHENKTLAQAAVASAASAAKPAKIAKNSKVLKVKKALREPASQDFMSGNLSESDGDVEEGVKAAEAALTLKSDVYDGADPDYLRFQIKDYEIKESAMIASQQNIYLRLPMLRLPSHLLHSVVEHPPIYELPEADSAENKEARFLQTLFERKRAAAFAQTLKHFEKKYPHSEYQQILSYMGADFLYQRWQETQAAADFDKAMNAYRNLLAQYPDSPLFERTALLVALSYQERGDHVMALHELQKFLSLHGNSKFAGSVRIALAQAYTGVNQPGDALRTLEEVASQKDNNKLAVEAVYRMGDVAFQNRDYAAAAKAYQLAQSRYPEEAALYPNAFFNLGEALFWNGHYRASLDSYRNYLSHFKNDIYGGYAMTRIAELLEILGADQRKVMGAFLESYYRYGNTPGGKIARLRLISQRIQNMKDKELAKALVEVDQIAKDSVMPEMPEFATIVISDGLYRRGEFAPSVDRLAQFYQSNPSSKNLSFISNRIVRSITQNIKSSIDRGHFMAALKTYSHFESSWLKNADRIDVRYYVGRGFEQAGAFAEASRLYAETLNRIYALSGTPLEKERNVFEVLPTVESLSLRLAAANVRQGEFAKAQDYLNQISLSEKRTSGKRLNEAEQVERVELEAEIAEKTGRPKDAISHLSKLIETWQGKPAQVEVPLLKLAEMRAQIGENAKAEDALMRLSQLKSDTGLVSEDTDARMLELKGDLLLKMKKQDEALETYSQLLTQYEKKRPLASVRYRAGEVEFKRGNIKAAEKFWAPLGSEKNTVWSKMAAEQLTNDQFFTDYRKYINRIPAMATVKESKP